MRNTAKAAASDLLASVDFTPQYDIMKIGPLPKAGVYIVYADGDPVYCGISNDLRRRISYLRKATASHHDKAADVQEALAVGQTVTISTWYESQGIPRQLIEQAAIYTFDLRDKWNAA